MVLKMWAACLGKPTPVSSKDLMNERSSQATKAGVTQATQKLQSKAKSLKIGFQKPLQLVLFI